MIYNSMGVKASKGVKAEQRIRRREHYAAFSSERNALQRMRRGSGKGSSRRNRRFVLLSKPSDGNDECDR